ncbi:sigma-54 dependent transcriptional regulator [Candidatus Liberibacter sp.]|uniref:nitrogen assimilation response regulator NtrX n=1 Tax=Candidatus Liberibacter sp. TaxID=34022 RepID=UPI0015F5574A|nr:sigma-54 dependent transcriptional regulator [Candidatus Liberibacter sp.]MBA5723729.1 sigma-54-dependent Fis family transcriptional regulator [Candidatus Liberibacter sp.]
MTFDILIIDAEKDIRDTISRILNDEGYMIRTAHNSDSALIEIANRLPQLILLNILINGSLEGGLSLLDNIKENYADIPVVMIFGHGDIEAAVSSIKHGAFDFIEKPFKTDRLLHTIYRAIENSHLKREVYELKKKIGGEEELIGISGVISQLRQAIDRVALTNSRILIYGLSGAGKELVARLIHKKSARIKGPFVVLKAADITSDRIESALFGKEDTLGKAQKIGSLEEAHQGTLYIDEIVYMPRDIQEKILRTLVQKKFKRVGGLKNITVDVRIISSTAVNPHDHIAKGLLREDLYYRLAVVPIRVPSLVERREDIPLLVESLINQICFRLGIRPRRISNDAMAILQAYDWPGNVRELRNHLEKILVLTRDEDPESEITTDMLPADLSRFLPTASIEENQQIMNLSLREAREIFEKNYLTAQINRFSGNISRTAEFVGMERSALHRKLKSLGL